MLLGEFLTSEVKNNYAYVITQDICNKFIEVEFSVKCMVWPSTSPFQPKQIFKNINKINGIFFSSWQN